MSKNNNMAIWSAADKTPVEYTKPVQYPYPHTSINTYAPMMRATELFGPEGGRWGFEILEDELRQGAPIQFNKEGDPTVYSQNHHIRIRLWVNDESGNQIAETFAAGATKYIYFDKKNQVVVDDEEAFKKTESDARKKALSWLGFGADVYLGMFDDADYLHEITTNASIEKDKKKDDADAKWIESKSRSVKLMKSATSKNEATGIYRDITRQATARNDNAFVKNITTLTEQVKLGFDIIAEADLPFQTEKSPKNKAA